MTASDICSDLEAHLIAFQKSLIHYKTTTWGTEKVKSYNDNELDLLWSVANILIVLCRRFRERPGYDMPSDAEPLDTDGLISPAVKKQITELTGLAEDEIFTNGEESKNG